MVPGQFLSVKKIKQLHLWHTVEIPMKCNKGEKNLKSGTKETYLRTAFWGGAITEN